MTSRTGTRNNRGFTLMELMVATAILTVGVLMVQEGLLRSANIVGRYQSSLKAQVWAGEKMWTIREDILYSDRGGPSETMDVARDSGKIFSASQIVETMPAGRELYSISIAVAWNEGERAQVLKRETYAAKPLEEPRL